MLLQCEIPGTGYCILLSGGPSVRRKYKRTVKQELEWLASIKWPPAEDNNHPVDQAAHAPSTSTNLQYMARVASLTWVPSPRSCDSWPSPPPKLQV